MLSMMRQNKFEKVVDEVMKNYVNENASRKALDFAKAIKEGNVTQKRGFLIVKFLQLFNNVSKTLSEMPTEEGCRGEWLEYLDDFSKGYAEVRGCNLILAALFDTNTLEEAADYIEKEVELGIMNNEEEEEEDFSEDTFYDPSTEEIPPHREQQKDEDCQAPEGENDSLLNRLVSPSVPIFEEERTIPSQTELK